MICTRDVYSISAAPTNVAISNSESEIYYEGNVPYVNVTSETEASFTCHAYEASPEPVIEWTLGSADLVANQSVDFTFEGSIYGPTLYDVSSVVRFTPDYDSDHDSTLSCSVSNDAVPEGVLEDVTLNVNGKNLGKVDKMSRKKFYHTRCTVHQLLQSNDSKKFWKISGRNFGYSFLIFQFLKLKFVFFKMAFLNRDSSAFKEAFPPSFPRSQKILGLALPIPL